MTLYLDNDALQKLATLDLLGEATGLSGHSDVAVVYTARYRYRHPKRAKQIGEDIAARILEFIDSCREIRPEPEGLGIFQGKPGIDAGEALLLLTALSDGGSIAWTGDKNCLRRLGADADFSHIVAALAGRIVCFEQVILRLIGVLGFDFVKAKVLAAPPGWDIAVGRVAFGSGAHSLELNVRAALEAEVGLLRAQTGRLLAV